eukprot:m.222497 g.222497  ORF g.222497 m.222497 type:complete len:456 (-) comp10774_c0_seq1:471-1838(-)
MGCTTSRPPLRTVMVGRPPSTSVEDTTELPPMSRKSSVVPASARVSFDSARGRSAASSEMSDFDLKARMNLVTPESPTSPTAVETSKIDFRMGENLEQVNQYKLYDVIGSGSNGFVRLCKSEPDQTSFAMKCISKKKLLRQEGFRRQPMKQPTTVSTCAGMQDLKREVAVLKKLSHPNIVRLFEVIDDSSHDTIYMIFELMPMGPVMDLTSNPHPFPEGRARMFFRQLVLAMEYLHHNNVIHRDIKPANILLYSKNTIKLADFGLSFMLDSFPAAMSFKRSAGTPSFLAPECIDGGAIIERPADMWALGVTLHCFMLGRTPWSGAVNVLQLYERIRSEEVLPVPCTINEAARDLILKLLDRDPTTRMTASNLRFHPWVSSHSQTLVPSTDNCGSPLAVTAAEVEGSMTVARTGLRAMITAKAMIKRRSFNHPFRSHSVRAIQTPSHGVPVIADTD